jgi:hypothetical protein
MLFTLCKTFFFSQALRRAKIKRIVKDKTQNFNSQSYFSHSKHTLNWGCTNPRRQICFGTKCLYEALNILGPSVWQLIHFILVASRILRRLLVLWKIRAPQLYALYNSKDVQNDTTNDFRTVAFWQTSRFRLASQVSGCLLSEALS